MEESKDQISPIATENGNAINASANGLVADTKEEIKKPPETSESKNVNLDSTQNPNQTETLRSDEIELTSSPKTETVKPENVTPDAVTSVAESSEKSSINDTSIKGTETDEEGRISRLEQEVQKRTEERDDYHKKLEEMEKKLAVLQSSYNAIKNDNRDEVALRCNLEELKNKLERSTMQLEDRARIVANQENQINALNHQVTSLKEVVAITRDLLQIRNMEVKHLQAEVDDMETKISAERERHNTMMNKMEAAVRLNADLKEEYETQLSLFQNLRERYEEKVTLLTEEKKALETAAQSAK